MKNVKKMLLVSIVIGCITPQLIVSKCSGGSCTIKNVRKTATIKSVETGNTPTKPVKNNTSRKAPCKNGSCSRR